MKRCALLLVAACGNAPGTAAIDAPTNDEHSDAPPIDTPVCGTRSGMRGKTNRTVHIASLDRTYIVYLPESVDTGDWIEIGHIGAYSLALRTRFNGFYPDTFVEVTTPFEGGGPAESFAALETMGAGQ